MNPSLYGKRPEYCPEKSATCGICNIYPCTIGNPQTNGDTMKGPTNQPPENIFSTPFVELPNPTKSTPTEAAIIFDTDTNSVAGHAFEGQPQRTQLVAFLAVQHIRHLLGLPDEDLIGLAATALVPEDDED